MQGEQNMKCLGFSKFGKDAYSVVSVPAPHAPLKEGQVRVKVHACALSPLDYKVAQGELKMVVDVWAPTKERPVCVLGHDLSGVVEESHCGEIPVGTAVFGLSKDTDAGCAAEYWVGDSTALLEKPADMPHEEAAALPACALTAMEMFAKADLVADGCGNGKTVLVLGGAGGVGHIALQVARNLGFANIITTASGNKMDLCRQWGATQVLDHRAPHFDLAAAIPAHSVDVCIDTIGDAKKAFPLCKKGTKIVSCAAAPTQEMFPTQDQLDDHTRVKPKAALRPIITMISAPLLISAKMHDVEYHFIYFVPNADFLRRIVQWYKEGRLRPHVQKVYPLDQAKEALQEVQSGRVAGKIVLKIRE